MHKKTDYSSVLFPRDFFSFPLKEKIARQIKNTPNARLSQTDGKYAAKNAPPTEKITAGIITQAIPFVSNKPLSACVFKATKLMGKKANKFAHCATFCSTLKRSNKGIVTVPPPIPIPAGIPPKKPNPKKI